MCRLKALDIKALQVLGEIVNVVPVIAKSDTLTPEERAAVKERVQRDIATYGIKVYPASSRNDYDAGEQARNAEISVRAPRHCPRANGATWLTNRGAMALALLQKLIPFAVVGSERNVVINGKAVRGRRNPWGFVSST